MRFDDAVEAVISHSSAWQTVNDEHARSLVALLGADSNCEGVQVVDAWHSLSDVSDGATVCHSFAAHSVKFAHCRSWCVPGATICH
jgi:hypothetical protein